MMQLTWNVVSVYFTLRANFVIINKMAKVTFFYLLCGCLTAIILLCYHILLCYKISDMFLRCEMFIEFLSTYCPESVMCLC